MKRVLHILSSNKLGGAENVSISIIENLSEDFDMAYSSPNGTIESFIKNKNVKYLPLENFSNNQIRKVIKKWNPDVIHAHDFKASVKSILVTSTPVISQIHQNPKWLNKVSFFSIIYFLASLKIKKIIVVSPAIKENSFLGKKFSNKTEIISNIVDIKAIKKKLNVDFTNEYDLIFIGRLIDIKNPIRFIEIVDNIKKEIPNIKAIMVGEGVLKENCLKLIYQKKLENNIEMIGFTDNPYPYLNNSKILIMTSKSEGLPIVILEALSLGKPVITSEMKGIHSLIDGCGYISKNNDEFHENIIKLMTSLNEYKELSYNAIVKSKELCDTNMYKQKIKQTYNSIHSEEI